MSRDEDEGGWGGVGGGLRSCFGSGGAGRSAAAACDQRSCGAAAEPADSHLGLVDAERAFDGTLSRADGGGGGERSRRVEPVALSGSGGRTVCTEHQRRRAG